MVYILGWISIYLGLIAERYLGKKYIWLSFIICLPVLLISFLRGHVGIDTISYEEAADLILNNEQDLFFEPGFIIYIKTLGLLGFEEFLIIRIIAILILIMVFIAAWRGGRDFSYYILAFFLPVFYYDFSMNSLRLGLAISFLLFSFIYFNENKVKHAIFFSVLAISFHYSSLIIILLYLFIENKIVLKSYIYLLVGIILLSIFYFYNIDYFSSKFSSYMEYSSPSFFSGLRHLAFWFLLFLSLFFSKINNYKKIKISLSTFFGFVIFFIVSKYSYAGLRMLELNTIVFSLLIIGAHLRPSISLSKKSKVVLLFTGLFGVFLTFYGYNNAKNQSESSFLPYSTFIGVER